MLVVLVGHGYLRGVADTRTPLVVTIVSNVVNVVLEVVLVYGFDLGVAGSAWGTVVAQLLAAGWFLVALGRQLAAAAAPRTPVAAALRRRLVAAPRLFVATAALLATHALATSIAARVDAATLGGPQITMQVHFFIAPVLDSLAIPGQVLVGTSLGAGDVREAR